MTTPWIEYLCQHGAQIAPSGTLRFGSPQEEARLAQEEDIIVPLAHLSGIEVSGEDAATFLQNMTSNDVKALHVGQIQHNSFNTAKGRMLASFLLSRSEAAYSVVLSSEIKTEILKKLKMYVLRTKVQLTDTDGVRCLLGLSGPRANEVIAALGSPLPGLMEEVTHQGISIQCLAAQRFILNCATEAAPALWEKLLAAGVHPAGTQAWQGLDITAGTPWITTATQDEFVAQMLNFELLGGVSFKKGCYPGQEIITRTQHIGKVKKRMYRVHIGTVDEVKAATDLYSAEFGTQSCGKIVMAAPAAQGGFDALAVMQTSAQQSGEVHITDPAGPVLEFLSLPYSLD